MVLLIKENIQTPILQAFKRTPDSSDLVNLFFFYPKLKKKGVDNLGMCGILICLKSLWFDSICNHILYAVLQDKQ